LSRFDADAVEVLNWAALLGPHITVARLVELTGQDANQVGAALERAERHAVLHPSDQGFRFPHDLIARGVYTRISPMRRQVMHRRVAELIEQEAALDIEHAADLAHHALASGDPGLGARALVSAGRLNLRFFANEDALMLARRGQQLAAQLSGAEQVCRRIELLEVMHTAAPVTDWEAAARECAALAEQALDHGELAHARLGYHMSSDMRWAHGNWSGARAESLQAELVTRGASDEEHVVGMSETAKCLAMLERDLQQADAMAMEARAMAERGRITYRALPAAEGILRYHENDMDTAESRLWEARTMCKSAGDRLGEFQANEYLVMVDMERRHHDAAHQKAKALLELGEKIREGSEAPFARALLGLCVYIQSGDDGLLREALDTLRAADAKHRTSYILNRAAEHDLAVGRLEDATSRAAEALDCAGVLDRGSEMLIARATLLAVARANGNREAQSQQRAAITELTSRQLAPWALARVEGHCKETT
jgi:predicted ATPase